MDGPINWLRLLYMLTQPSRRISDLSHPDSILKGKIASEKSFREKNAAAKKYIGYYRPIYLQYKTNTLRVLRSFLQKKDLIVVY